VLNDVYLRRGRWVDPARADEVLASEIFCDAHGFNPGDHVAAIINGRRRSLTIVGIALSPEYVYAIRPGAIFPDKRQFGIFWMSRGALASAFDMEGGFNDVSVAIAQGANATDVIAGLDGLLATYGGFGATPRSLQTSAWMLDNELRQLQTFGFITPAIFFGVAAFILNVALTRALSLQRSQIAALKALGYSNRALAWHYIKWALVIAGSGALVGVAAGAWLGSNMIGLYNEFFRFPALDFHLAGGVAALSVILSLAVAAMGAQSAVRRAVRIPPDPSDPNGFAQSRTSACPVGSLRARHRLRCSRAVCWAGVHRCHERADQRAVRHGHAPGCAAELRRTSVAAGLVLSRASARCHGH
jgi:putative ABC transport system permease protein